MNNKLKYTQYRSDGIFGQFFFDNLTTPFCVTLSHAFAVPGPSNTATFAPIVKPGTPENPVVLTCIRGTHQLANGVPFETFEITGVEGHSGLLFHAGNFNKDSEGCTLLGKAIADQADGEEMITDSKATFAAWMTMLSGVDEFNLVVE